MDPTTKSWIRPLTFLSNHSNGKTKSKKMNPSKMLINEDVNDCMDFRYQRMQMINKPRTIEDEGHRANTNQINNIPTVPNNSWWYWFQRKHP
jgi:hypothetical protein